MVSRRKQAVTRRIIVDLGQGSSEDIVITSVAANIGSPMSPNTEQNEQLPKSYTKDIFKLMNGCHKEADIPEEMVLGTNGISLQGLLRMQTVKNGGEAQDVPKDLISVKAAVGEQQKEEEKIQEYLQRTDTAVILPESIGQHTNVPTLTNGITKDGSDISGSENFIKCPHCQKGCATFQTLKEHIESCHTVTEESHTAALPSPSIESSPPPRNVVGGGSFGCSQCTTSFTSKDQLEKHELLHSPNAQVSCKVCHKTFANVYRLQRHMISHDESAILRKFKCTECEKAFKFKHHLKEHIRIHSGEKPFECGNCGKRFSHSGSYSSHMTSKKCLVMNLKMGRNRTATNTLLDKNQFQLSRTPKRSPVISVLNNNITTSPNQNTPYLPILPKYSEAAAAFLSVMAPRDGSYHPTTPSSTSGLHPFYMTPPALNLGGSGHSISPYTMSASLGQLLEQLQTSHSPHSRIPQPISDSNLDENETEVMDQDVDNKISIKSEISKDVLIENRTSSRCSNELVMDTDGDFENDEAGEMTARNSPGASSNNGDLEAVKRILETVNATVTKQLLQVNMQKLSSDSPRSDCPSVSSSVSNISINQITCTSCKKNFVTQAQLDDHECDAIQSEGLAAKLEQAVHVKTEDGLSNGNISGGEEENENDFRHCEKTTEDYDIDSESVTTTDHVAEDGRKVRVRSLIADEQLAILKDHYANNPRPKREELSRIAERIGFPVRVVQVWFQNTRARDRREGRLVQIPYSPLTSTSCFPQSIVPSTTSHMALSRTLPYDQIPTLQGYHNNTEQPLDLSTKKGPLSLASSPSSSPQRPTSAIAHSDSGEEAVNLSQKSSRSPTPFQQLPYHTGQYQHSNCSSDYHRSPSPVHPEVFSNGSRLARILAQPAHRLAIAGMGSTMGLVSVERLLQFNTEISTSRSPLLSTSCSSPNSERRLWKMEETEDAGVSQETYQTEDECPTKRSKIVQMNIKGLNNTLLNTTSQETEAEGQFICDQCDKAFSKQSSLARHKYEHSGQRPHKCDECPKAFKHKHHLTEHKRLHSGEKPFQCSKCLKRFSHSGSYSQHMNHRYSYCKPYRE